MANLLLGVTGSVAAIYTPELYAALKNKGHAVKIVATKSSQYFFDVTKIDPINPAQPVRNKETVILDEDEWPGAGYRRGDPVMHIELRRWADLLVIAPLDANTLAKLAAGICDNCLTCVWRAWDRSRPVVLAPAMNTFMWENPITERQLSELSSFATIVPPQVKRLACEDVGMGAMASLDDVVAGVCAALERK